MPVLKDCMVLTPVNMKKFWRIKTEYVLYVKDPQRKAKIFTLTITTNLAKLGVFFVGKTTVLLENLKMMKVNYSMLMSI